MTELRLIKYPFTNLLRERRDGPTPARSAAFLWSAFDSGPADDPGNTPETVKPPDEFAAIQIQPRAATNCTNRPGRNEEI